MFWLSVNILYCKMNVVLLISVSFHSVQIKHIWIFLQDVNTSRTDDSLWLCQKPTVLELCLFVNYSEKLLVQTCHRTVLDTQLWPKLSDGHLLQQLLLTTLLFRMHSNVLPGLDLLIHFYGATLGHLVLWGVSICSVQEEFNKWHLYA